MKELISTLNDISIENSDAILKFKSIEDKKEFIFSKLPKNFYDLMMTLPSSVASQLMLDRDPYGNVPVSFIETEKLLIEMIDKRLAELKKRNKYKGTFFAITHFFGYEGRCGIPSNFDGNYTYALGYSSALLILNGFTGYMSYVRNLTKNPLKWECGGVPLTTMMNIEKRFGKERFVIEKILVDLNGKPFKELVRKRNKWAINENYISPGPIQYFGHRNVTEMITRTLHYEHQKK
jgi:pyrophosphate--fructose-6-phosphate 1-phosphotransferase